MTRGVTAVLTVVLAVVSVAAVIGGWHLFWFQCDDAYIAFRYVSNSQLGYGYVWNAPPWAPVEGYTSFAWVVLLDWVWTLTGSDPAHAANRLSLVLSLLSVGVIGVMLARLPLSPRLVRLRLPLAALVLLGILSNRTFMTWTSSGLETALFDLLLLSWTAVAFLAPARPWRPTALMGVAALIALTRPDGLLFVAASAVAVVLWTARARTTATRAASLYGLVPMAVVVAHLAWRHATYGYWLPNTYYAKSTGLWPHMGLAYVTAFTFEYGFWLVIAVGVIALVGALRAGAHRRLDLESVTRIGLLSVLFAHTGYYTLVVGGDHFEYRVLAHWVVLAFVALPVLLDRVGTTPKAAISLMLVAVLSSWPIPWSHWWMTSGMTTRTETHTLRQWVTAFHPFKLWGNAWAFDGLEEALVVHHVGMRHQEHKVFVATFARTYPTREEGSKITGEDFPIHAVRSVGIPGWTLPHVAILDKFGLNDRVVARNPIDADKMTLMAHSRSPPKGYVRCLRPNVRVNKRGEVTVKPRQPPLTADDIRACEARFLAKVGG